MRRWCARAHTRRWPRHRNRLPHILKRPWPPVPHQQDRGSRRRPREKPASKWRRSLLDHLSHPPPPKCPLSLQGPWLRPSPSKEDRGSRRRPRGRPGSKWGRSLLDHFSQPPPRSVRFRYSDRGVGHHRQKRISSSRPIRLAFPPPGPARRRLWPAGDPPSGRPPSCCVNSFHTITIVKSEKACLPFLFEHADSIPGFQPHVCENLR